jgi:hypothetical protein
MLGKDGFPVPNAAQCAKFLRAHSVYLNTGKTEWPYVNSARAISNINNAAADMLEGSGAVAAAEREAALRLAIIGIVGRWRDFGGKDMEEFIQRAEVALRKQG